jgi:hypothetical protein
MKTHKMEIMMYKYLFFSLLILVLLFALAFGHRIYHGYLKKRNTVNTYAIQNVKTGKNIRVYNAGINDETKIILYTHHNWECMTWQFIQLEGDAYLLKNLYTQKTFQPSSSPMAGIDLWQQILGGDNLQYWEFIKQSDETYLIRLKGTELYITISSDKNNSSIILLPIQNSAEQQWRLIEQHPIF